MMLPFLSHRESLGSRLLNVYQLLHLLLQLLVALLEHRLVQLGVAAGRAGLRGGQRRLRRRGGLDDGLVLGEARADGRRIGALQDDPYTKKEFAVDKYLQNSYRKTPQALHSIAARSQRSLGCALVVACGAQPVFACN